MPADHASASGRESPPRLPRLRRRGRTVIYLSVLFPGGRCAKFLAIRRISFPGPVVCLFALGCLLLLPRLLAQPCSIDLSFDPGLNPGADIYALAMQTNGQILIGGSFTS